MRLYAGHSQQFIDDATRNQIADKLEAAFFQHFGYRPSNSEIASWKNSLRAMKDVVQSASLTDHGVLLEYQLPQASQRLDFMICGRDSSDRDNAVVVELKQWDKCEPSDAPREVVTWVGRGLKDVLHPSVQVGQYVDYLSDMQSAFYDGQKRIVLQGCAYLHNYPYSKTDPLFDPKFASYLERFPIFTQDDFDRIRESLRQRVSGGDGMRILSRIEESKYRPSKKLMDHVAAVIAGKKEYVLLDEQLIAYDRVQTIASRALKAKDKAIVMIKGGPGTGKSVIALNLMADLLEQGFNAQYATGSKAFTETLWEALGTRSKSLFRYFNNYGASKRGEVDVLIADEAHRIRETSNSRFTKKENKSTKPQIEELLHAAKTTVFLIDDKQVVRPGEVGSTELIRAEAVRHKADYFEYELEAQFRCAGSDAFVKWINNTLEIEPTAQALWSDEEVFDFRVLDSPDTLDRSIREKAGEGKVARVTAGFCWPWSDPKSDGTLVNDVVIGNFKRPWNARPEAGRLARNIPKSSLWAYDPNGLEQVGCVYTAQGFDFDYVGIIWGPDLRYDLDGQKWIGDRTKSADAVVKRSGEEFLRLVKNTYRVLVSRGMKGCYVYFMDKDTERFIKSRIRTHAKSEH